MSKYKIFKIITSLLFLLMILSSCKGLIENRGDARKSPPNPDERVKRNIEEGRGFTLMGQIDKEKQGGTFSFASSNELWRASLDIIDFMPLASANYSGGIIITDWYSSEGNLEESIKISIRFLTNEIRSDSLDIKIFYKKCAQNANCAISEKKGNLVTELNKKILNRAANYAKQNKDKNFKKYNPGPKSQNN
jgi:hypothetical protein|tara:strand:+ start:1345 stop:1920 length:576 start_codon:yes stop_codon:yes gene_type:complete